MRRAKITKVTQKWVRQNGTPVPFEALKLSPFDALKASGSMVKEVYDTPIGRYMIDPSGRLVKIEGGE